MRFPLSKGTLTELLVFQVVVYRVLHFAFVTLDNSSQQLKMQLESSYEEKEIACRRFAQILSSLEVDARDSLVGKTKAELVEHIHECSRDLADLRAFGGKLNSFYLLSYTWNENRLITKIISDLARSSTTPTNAFRCRTYLCVDWVSLIDLTPWQSAVLTYLPLSPQLYSGLLFIGSLGIVLAGFIAFHLASRCLRRVMDYLHPYRLSTFLIVLEAMISERGRILRIACISLLYVSAFAICADEPSTNLLLRVLRGSWTMDKTRLAIFVVIHWILATVLIRRLSWVHERMTYDHRLRTLALIDSEIARAWIESGTDRLRHLAPQTLIKILTIVNVKGLPTHIKTEISNLILADQFLMAVYSQRGAFSTKDHSKYAVFTRQIATILHELGYREYPGISSFILVGIVIATHILLW